MIVSLQLWSLGLAGANSETVLARQGVFATASEVSESVSSLQQHRTTADGCWGLLLQCAWTGDSGPSRARHLARVRFRALLPRNSVIISPCRKSVTPLCRASPRTIRSSKCPAAALPATTRFGSPTGGSVPGCEDRTLPSAERLEPPTLMTRRLRRLQRSPTKKCLLANER